VLRHMAARRDKGATAQGIPGVPVPPAVPRGLHPEGPKPRTSVPHWCQVSTFSSETLHLSHCSVFSSIHLNLTYWKCCSVFSGTLRLSHEEWKHCSSFSDCVLNFFFARITLVSILGSATVNTPRHRCHLARQALLDSSCRSRLR